MITKLIPFWLLLLITLLLFTNYANATSLNKKNSCRRVTIISKEGKYLTITEKKATGEDTSNSYSKLMLRSVGLNGEVTIQGVKANKFLVMNSTGQVYLTRTAIKEAVFVDVYLSGNTPFRSFRSTSDPKNYLAISTTGRVTNSTAQNSPGVQFAIFNN